MKKVIKKKLEETKQHAFEKKVLQREKAKGAPRVGEFYKENDILLEDIDLGQIRIDMKREGEDITNSEIVEITKITRTKAFLDDFAEVLSMADVIVLADIFAAREQNTFGVSSKDILERLTAKGKDAHYFPSFEEIEKFLLKNCMNGDLLITMGAGNVVEIGESLLGK